MHSAVLYIIELSRDRFISSSSWPICNMIRYSLFYSDHPEPLPAAWSSSCSALLKMVSLWSTFGVCKCVYALLRLKRFYDGLSPSTVSEHTYLCEQENVLRKLKTMRSNNAFGVSQWCLMLWNLKWCKKNPLIELVRITNWQEAPSADFIENMKFN